MGRPRRVSRRAPTVEATLQLSHPVADICGCVSGPTLSCVIKGSRLDMKLSVKAVSN